MAETEKELNKVSDEDLIVVAGGRGNSRCGRCGAWFDSADEVRAHWATCTGDFSWRNAPEGSAPKNQPSPEMAEVLKKMHEVADRRKQ